VSLFWTAGVAGEPDGAAFAGALWRGGIWRWGCDLGWAVSRCTGSVAAGGCSVATGSVGRGSILGSGPAAGGCGSSRKSFNSGGVSGIASCAADGLASNDMSNNNGANCAFTTILTPESYFCHLSAFGAEPAMNGCP
jgi:hypothetical protein